MEKTINEMTKIITDIFKPSMVLIEQTLKRRFANNFIQTYKLSSTTERTPLQFQNDTGNEPINKIEVLTVGGGLRLWLNGNSYGVEVSTGSIIDDVEINRLEYEMVSGIGNIMVFARVN